MPVPKVTVLMTVYNGGEYLKLSIASILKQTFKDFEFLIINDCSTDNTLQIIDSFSDPRIAVYTNERNIGQTKSLNVGLRIAKGEYVARIDADDVAFFHWLEQQVLTLTNLPDYAVISVYDLVIDENNQYIKISQPPQDMNELIVRSFIRSPINHVGSLLKKSAVLDVGGYDEKFKIAADYDLWVRLLIKNYKLTTTPQILMAYRSHSASLSKQGKRDDIKEVEQIMKKATGHFTTTKLLDEDIQVLCRAFYNEGDLTVEELDKATMLLKNVYSSLMPVIEVDAVQLSRWVDQQAKVFHLKRIYQLILRKRYREVRDVSVKGICRFGIFGVFSGFFILSLFGGFFINLIPGLYFNLHKFKACLIMKYCVNRDNYSLLTS